MEGYRWIAVLVVLASAVYSTGEAKVCSPLGVAGIKKSGERGPQYLRLRGGGTLVEPAYGGLFTEWLSLAGLERLDNATRVSTPITEKDALVVIDMQRDFVPCSSRNADGGRFGVPEGDSIVAPIAHMIAAAAKVGATIIASRDYHPHDHCSFAHEGGSFPSHCVQGSAGAEFLPEIKSALEDAMRKCGPEKVFVAFKGIHEHTDSFGALPYVKPPHGDGRLAKAANAGSRGGRLNKLWDAIGQSSRKLEGIMGCADAPWTGSLVLKQSVIACASDENVSPAALCV